MDNVSIIITTRNEDLLEWTVRNIERTANPAEIIIVYDGLQKVDEFEGAIHLRTPWTTPQGVGKCRDFGADNANSLWLVFIDAHMDFNKGWIDKMLEVAKTHGKKAIYGTRSAYIDHNGMKSTKHINSGAYIRKYGTATGIPLEVEWGEPFEAGEVQCCLGACYMVEWSHYLDIGAPWANAFGWGTSEQTLCMVNEFCGGKNIMVDEAVGHVYRDNKAIPYHFGHDHKVGRVYNRMRLISLLPIPQGEKTVMLNQTMAYRPLRTYAEYALDMLRCVDDSAIKERMTLSWEDYCARWWVDEPKRVAPTPQPRRDKLRRTVNDHKDERFI